MRRLTDFVWLKVEIRSRTLIRPGLVHRGSARSDYCDWVFPVVLSWAHSVIHFYTWYCRIVRQVPSRWLKGVCVFRSNLPHVVLEEWPGSFMCHYGQMGLERTPNKSQHTMLNLEKSILQRERGFCFLRLCGCRSLSCCCMSQTSLKRILSASFGENVITLDYAAQF